MSSYFYNLKQFTLVVSVLVQHVLTVCRDRSSRTPLFKHASTKIWPLHIRRSLNLLFFHSLSQFFERLVRAFGSLIRILLLGSGRLYISVLMFGEHKRITFQVAIVFGISQNWVFVVNWALIIFLDLDFLMLKGVNIHRIIFLSIIVFVEVLTI